MEAFLARQPIFDRALAVAGYEIFFREGSENFFSTKDGDQATAQVIESALHTFGMGSLAQGRRAFINLTAKILQHDIVRLLPPKGTVIEILETVEPDRGVLAACRTLKEAGFQIALDDFTPQGIAGPLLPLADILKIDFRSTEPMERAAIVKKYARPGLRFLAEKVETRLEQEMANRMGFVLFQGYFFSRPEVISRTDIPAYKLNYLRILQEASRPEIDFDRLEEIVRQDVALSLKLLRYINSAMVGLQNRVESIKQAMVLVGGPQIKRWVTLLTISSMGEDRPTELTVTALVRARFCEELGILAGHKVQSFDLFLMGMLSLIDAIVGRPMTELIGDLAVTVEVRAALLGNPGGLGRFLRLAVAYEKGDWSGLSSLCQDLHLGEHGLPTRYQEAVVWADRIFATGRASAAPPEKD